MLKINIALIISFIISVNILSETKNNGRVLIPKLYLEYQYSGVSYDAHGGFTIIKKPYYSFDQSYIDQKVNFLGRNIAKEMIPVPKAKQIMNGYMIHGIGEITCWVAGVGTLVLSAVNKAQNGSGQKPDGTYDVKVPIGIPIGFGLIGLGVVMKFTKPIYLHAAVKEYNKYARRIN